MDSLTREAFYQRQNRSTKLTPRQRRRVVHKRLHNAAKVAGTPWMGRPLGAIAANAAGRA